MDNIRDLNEGDYVLMLIVLTRYLYAKYYKCGIVRGDKCNIVAKDLKRSDLSGKCVKTAIQLINLRNMICHEYGSEKNY